MSHVIVESAGLYIRVRFQDFAQTVGQAPRSPFVVLLGKGPEPAFLDHVCDPGCGFALLPVSYVVDSLKQKPRMDSLRAAEARQVARQRSAARTADRLKRYRALGWSEDDISTILAGKIRIGFTARQVRESIGRPGRINTTITASGTNEQWVYGSNYVYFDNGIVTSIQTSRCEKRAS